MMKIDAQHLSNLLPEVQKQLELSDKERLYHIEEDKWIGYPIALDIIDKLETLLNYPKKNRMPGLLIIGDTNNGKTSIIKRFASKYKAFKDSEKYDATQIRVISTQAPSGPDVGHLYSRILELFAVPYNSTEKVPKKEEMIRNYLNKCGAKMLIIDEIHNILSGPISKQKQFMNTLKNLSNDLQIAIVLSGIKDALYATNTDPQINNRFKPIFLTKWKLNKDFLSLLAGIEKTLPLKKASNLATTKAVALKIYDLSEGNIGEVFDLIVSASELAIKSQSEQITLKEIKECGFVKPSMRKSFDEMVNL